LRVLARLKPLRGSIFDPFGKTAERRLERRLIRDFEARCDELLPQLSAENLPLAIEIARVPLKIRGYGHVKLAQLAIARAQEAELLSRFDPARYPRPERTINVHQFKGITVTSGR
jgi:indolepyruvate ferredoxin oxidoreductase